MTKDRQEKLRYYAALRDHITEVYGSDLAVSETRIANRVADELGDFTQEDWGVIKNAQREYIAER